MRKAIHIIAISFVASFVINPDYAYSQITSAAPLSLNQAINKSLESNFGIRTARLRTDISSVNNSWGAAGALPSLSTSLSGSSSISDQTNNPTSFIQGKIESESVNTALNLNWTLFDGLGMYASKTRLELLEAQSEGQASLIIEQTVEAVDKAYHNVLLQTELLNVLSESMSLSRQRLNEIQWSESYGAAGTFDRLQFENAILTDSTSWLQQGVAVKSAKRNLNLIMGDSEDYMWILIDELNAPPSLPSSIDVSTTVLKDNTSVQNAIIYENIAHQGVKQAQAFLYPVIGFKASFSDAISKGSFGELEGTGRSVNTSAFLTLNFNLFNGGATRRAISAAKIQADIAAIDQEQVIKQAGSLSSNAYDKYILGASVYNLSVKATQNALISLEIGETSYKNGVINALDYRALEIALQRARVNELTSLFVWRGAYVEVSRLMGALRAPLLSE